MVVKAKKIPAKISGMAVCNLRSRRRSDDFAMYHTEIVASTKGKAESSVAVEIEVPDAF